MFKRGLVTVGFVTLLCSMSAVSQTAPPLGTAAPFMVLGGSTVTNTGPSVLGGDLGVWPGLAITGFPPGTVAGVIHPGDAVAQQAQSDVTIAYNSLAGQACSTSLTGQDLGGMTLLPGVYCFSSSAQLTGTLTLNALGNSASVFIFQIGSTLTTASNSTVQVINGGLNCNVFWQVGSSATIGTTTTFVGNLLALTSITLNTSANVSGRILARNGAVTLDTNNINITACATGPTPTSTPTSTPVPPTATPTNTPVPPTATPTNTPTGTPIPPTATPTNTPTGTPVPPTVTPTGTPVLPTATPTSTPVGTPALPTATPTSTPVSTPTTPNVIPALSGSGWVIFMVLTCLVAIWHLRKGI